MTRKKKRMNLALNPPYAAFLFLAVVALALLGPLREFALSVGAPVTVPATLLLFMMPGIVLVGLLNRTWREDPDAPTKVPLAFALSVSLFGILAVPPLVLQWPTRDYLVICGIVVALSLLGTLFLALQDRGEPVESVEVSGRGSWLLWAPLAILAAVMVAASTNAVQRPDADFWAYLMYVRDFMGSEQLNAGTSGFSRTTFSGWLLEQAALSRISGVDPVVLLSRYLGPILVVVAILALYGLARVLFEDSRPALVAASLASIFFLSHMAYADSGNELLVRITEDKFLARFIFLPVTLGLAVLFLRTRRLVYLGVFTFLCWSVITVHYIGFVLIGISLVGFGLVHVIFNLRNRWSWTAFLALGGVMFVAGLPALVFVLKNGISFLAQLDSGSPEGVAVMVFLAQYSEHLTVLGEDSYIMHPALILDPFVLTALVAGIPFLAYQARRRPAAHMLLGMLLFTAFLVYFPPVSSLIGEVIGPWTLWRVAWPIELAALLTLGWLAWWVLGFVGASYLGGTDRTRRLVPFLPLVFIGVLLAVFLGSITNGVRSVSAAGETPLEASACEDPLFVWMQDVVTEPTVVFSKEEEHRCIQAYDAEAILFSYRSSTYVTGQALLKGTSGEQTDLPQVVADEQKFFGARVFDEEMIQILKRNGAGYVVLPQDSPLNDQLKHLPGFEALDNPGSRYRFYSVAANDLRRTPAVAMNDLLAEKDWEGALASYPEVLEGDKEEQFLAHVGAGLAYMELDEPGRAAQSYEQALLLFPDSPTVYPSLAEAYREDKDRRAARQVLRKAVDRYPEDVALRFEFASMLVSPRAREKALEEYRTVVEAHPDVPNYRARLGGALLEVGEREAAEAEFERAIRLNPLSLGAYLQVGQENEAAGRPKKAAEVYERAVRMGLDNQLVRIKLGKLYATFVEQGEDEYFGRAEEQLTKAAGMIPQSPTSDQSAAAYLALGDLYRSSGRPEDARAAYEKALRLKPDLEPAKNRLEQLP